MSCMKCMFFDHNKEFCLIDMVEANEKGNNCRAFRTVDAGVVKFGTPVSDPVNHPAHYTSGKVECIDCIESALGSEQFKGFLKGNVIKYVFRCGKKDSDIQDLNKAKWYLEKLISTMEQEKASK